VSKEKAENKEHSSMISALRTSLLGVGVLTLIGLALGTYGASSYLSQVAFHHSEIQHLRKLRSDVDLRERQLVDSALLLPDFEALQQQGVIGALAKTSEADRFEQMAANHPANVASFAMGAVDAIAAPPDLAFSTLALGRHELTFVAQPRHEVHLLRLLGQLPTALGGLSLLRSCDITRSIGIRTGAEEEGSSLAGGSEGEVRARCAIDWYVFGPSGANPSTDSFSAQGENMTMGGVAR